MSKTLPLGIQVEAFFFIKIFAKIFTHTTYFPENLADIRDRRVPNRFFCSAGREDGRYPTKHTKGIV